MKYYLAYGSNLSINKMSSRCSSAIPIGTALIDGYKLVFKGSKTGNYLTIEEKKGSKVPVVVWRVSKHDEESLDVYEGYPIFYEKKDIEKVKVSTFVDTEVTLDCFVYLMPLDREYGLPTDSYYDLCAEGYKRFGLEKKYLIEAVEYTSLKEKTKTIEKIEEEYTNKVSHIVSGKRKSKKAV